MSRVNLNSKAAKLLGKPIKSETSRQEVRFIKKEKLDEEFEDSEAELENDLDDDEEIDELLQFPVSSSILDDQCGSPSDLNQLSYLIHDSDSGSSHFDDGYQSSATSIAYNSNSQLLSEGKRPLKGNNNGTLLINGQSGTNHDQLLQVHNYSCIKQDKFLHSANKQLGNPHLVANAGNQLVYLKHDGLLNSNSNYTSSNSSLSGGSNSSSPTQSPNARKSNYGRRLAKGDEQQRNQNGLRSGNQCSQLKLQQTGSGRGSRSKPITDLHLTDEERRLLNKEGYHDFPAGDHPILTKSEEKILRKIRRKIRNKRSAQCSRQRKKEYLEELEKKYQKTTNELQCLKSEVQKLRRQNVGLISKLQKVMRFVGNQSINLDDDDQLSSGDSSLTEQQLPDQICGEQINYLAPSHQTQSEATDERLSVLGDNSANLGSSTEDLSSAKDDRDQTNGDPASLDDEDLFGLLQSNGEIEFDFENFEFSDLREDLKDDDGLLSYVNRLNSSDSQFESQLLNTNSPDHYHQQAPVKTSLFILVLCFVLMFVPFLR